MSNTGYADIEGEAPHNQIILASGAVGGMSHIGKGKAYVFTITGAGAGAERVGIQADGDGTPHVWMTVEEARALMIAIGRALNYIGKDD